MNRNTLKGMLLAFALGGAGLLLGVAWNPTYEAIPAGTDLAADLDLFIQSVKTELRQHLEAEHLFGGNTDDNGLHQMGSARCFVQNGAPTDISGGVAVLGQYNSAASADGGTLLTTDEIGPTVRDLGAGRCWIDLDGPDNLAGTPDDGSLAIWNETTNLWVYRDLANPAAVTLAAQRFFFDPGKYNQLTNGSFELTDGTGLLASATVPSGWALVAINPTISYTSPPSGTTEGVGVQLNLARGAGDGGIEQTLTSLKSDTTYYAVARVRAVAGATCELSTTAAGGTNLAAQTTASATYTTLSGIFTTTAGAVDTLTLRLRVLTAGSCNFDHVAVYELSADRRGISQPGAIVCFDTDATTTTTYAAAMTDVPGLSCALTTPAPGYVILVDAAVTGDNDTGSNEGLEVELREDCGGGPSPVATSFCFTVSNNADISDMCTDHIHYAKTDPIPGTTCTYTLRGASLGALMRSNDQDGNNISALATASTLRAELVPTR